MNANAPSPAGQGPFDLPQVCLNFSERSPLATVALEGPTHVIRYLNPAFARLIGKSAVGLMGRPFAETVPELEGSDCLGLLDRVFRTGTPGTLADQERRCTPHVYWSYAAWAILAADERPMGVAVQVTEVTDAAAFRRQVTAMNEALVLSAVRQHELIDDIRRGERDRREFESQLFRAQKTESLGVLAGGIAHDLGNMLTPVLGFTELALNSLPEDSPTAPMLEEVVKNARRAADLVRQVLAYSGKGRFVVGPIDLTGLVREMAALLTATVSIDAEIRYDLVPDLPPVDADAAQLRQVVVNLVANASEALPEGRGTVTVRTGSVAAGDGMGPAVFLEVADTGCGMAPDVAEKAFDPFFTTKFTGRGLGLAAVQGIARGHGGAISVRSEPGRGSAFRLLLPTSVRPAIASIGPRPAEDWRGTGTVLVIDDEEQLRDFAAFALRRAGLAVLAAGDGEEGVRAFRERAGEIDAVVLDLTMPRMGGLEAAAELQRLRPGLPVVLMSGFSIAEVTLQTAGLGMASFVQKPFAVHDLLAAVRHALGQ